MHKEYAQKLLKMIVLIIQVSINNVWAIDNQSSVLVFISSSMSTTSIQQWMLQSKQIGTTVIIRGLINNSWESTQIWLQNLLKNDYLQDSSMAINPVAFEQYGIIQVPAVVVTKTNNLCPNNMGCQKEIFDVVYGNASLAKALETIVDKQGQTSDIAQQYLIKIRSLYDN